MKIYIVKAPYGKYEDYREPIVKVFTDKAKAKEYVKAENSKLPLEQSKKCQECFLNWLTCSKPCRNLDENQMCINYFKYRDVQKLFIEEYEVEEK